MGTINNTPFIEAMLKPKPADNSVSIGSLSKYQRIEARRIGKNETGEYIYCEEVPITPVEDFPCGFGMERANVECKNPVSGGAVENNFFRLAVRVMPDHPTISTKDSIIITEDLYSCLWAKYSNFKKPCHDKSRLNIGEMDIEEALEKIEEADTDYFTSTHYLTAAFNIAASKISSEGGGYAGGRKWVFGICENPGAIIEDIFMKLEYLINDDSVWTIKTVTRASGRRKVNVREREILTEDSKIARTSILFTAITQALTGPKNGSPEPGLKVEDTAKKLYWDHLGNLHNKELKITEDYIDRFGKLAKKEIKIANVTDSIYKPIGTANSKDGENAYTLLDILANEYSPNPEKEAEFKELLDKVFRVEVPIEDAFILIKHFGLFGEKEKTLKEIAEEVHLTVNQVCYRLKNMMEKIRRKSPQ